jgi:ribosome-binding factor A
VEQSKKQRQIGALIQKEFSTVLREEGPLMYGASVMVTVTNVRMSSDMGIAYIYVSVFNAPYKQEIVKELWENLSRLRGELGRRIRKQVRRIPLLKFYIDDTLDEMEHIDRLFDQINSNTGNGTRSMKEAREAQKRENNTEDEA